MNQLKFLNSSAWHSFRLTFQWTYKNTVLTKLFLFLFLILFKLNRFRKNCIVLSILKWITSFQLIKLWNFYRIWQMPGKLIKYDKGKVQFQSFMINTHIVCCSLSNCLLKLFNLKLVLSAFLGQTFDLGHARL